MEYLALYRKYRPQSFKDVVDQEGIIKILTNSIKENKISHAYLFSGPRGTGKTTVAKLLAKAINCLNLNADFSICHKCENCYDIDNNSSDIIEIDAASNNGIEEIRELKSKINLVPSKLKYKVYIIDEVHMLSISAFNALLKTIEEPPTHVVFILATTEFYKVPSTIVSRCQCLTFTKVSQKGMLKKLKEIATLEKINITDEALEELITYADGGLRDALSMLDKLASYSLKEITLSDFLRINGLISKSDLNEFIRVILKKDNHEMLEKISKFSEQGLDYLKLVELILERLRDLMIEYYKNTNQEFDPKELYQLIFVFNEIYKLLKETVNRKIIFEVKLLAFMNFPDYLDNKNDSLKTTSIISQEISKNKKNEQTKQKNEGNKKTISDLGIRNYFINEKIKLIRIKNTFAMASKTLKNIAITKWDDLTNYIVDTSYKEVAGYLKDTEIGVVSDENILLVSKYETIIEKIYSSLKLCEELVTKIINKPYKLVIITTEEFNKEVNEYKQHINEENYYQYQEETEEILIYKEDNLCYGNLVDKAITAFGKDCIEIK